MKLVTFDELCNMPLGTLFSCVAEEYEQLDIRVEGLCTRELVNWDADRKAVSFAYKSLLPDVARRERTNEEAHRGFTPDPHLVLPFEPMKVVPRPVMNPNRHWPDTKFVVYDLAAINGMMSVICLAADAALKGSK